MKAFYLFIPLMILFISGCKEDEKNGSVDIVFRALYNNEPLVLLQSYPFGDNQTINFSHLAYFINDLEVVSAKGEVVALKDIALIDMDFSTVQQSEEGSRYSFPNIPSGNYEEFRIGIGVKPSLNDTRPADYTSSHPLSLVSHYWPGWNSYIFSKTEGNLDVDGNGTFDMGFALHTGSNKEVPVDLFRELSAQISFDLPADATREIILYLDYGKLLDPDSGTLDVENNPHTNDPNNMDLSTQLVDNYMQAFSISIP